MEDPLHLGNVISILSTAHGFVTGRIVYRDITMVRIVSQDASDRAIEFPLVADGSKFVPELGVSDIEIIESQDSDYFVDTLGARVGETLEFFTLDGGVAEESGVVAEIMKSATKDSIRLEDGRVLKFRGKGPSLPIAVIRVTTVVKEVEGQAEGQAEGEGRPEGQTFGGPIDVLALLRGVLPSATVEMVPTADRTYPDSMQREDMLQDLLADIPAKQRTNPRRIRFVEREVDLALALKNRTTLRSASGRSMGPNNKSILTLNDALAENTVAAAIPIVKAAKVLNIDSVPEGTPFKPEQVAPRSLAQNESDSEMLAQIYLNGAAPEFTANQAIVDRARGLGFYSYIYDLTGRDQVSLAGVAGGGWSEDQDVIRTEGLGTAVQGLSKGLTVDAEVTPAFLLSDVTDRGVRVLTSDVFTNSKTGFKAVVAPSDPSVVMGHVILPIKAALSLRPPKRAGDLPTALIYSAALDHDNLPTIAQTLRDLYAESADPLHAWTAGPDSTVAIADWLQTVLPYAVHPADALGPRSPRILSILDSIGGTDVSPPVREVIMSWVEKSQQTWQVLLDKRRQAIQATLDGEVDITFDNISGPESTLFVPASTARPTALQSLIDSFAERNPAIEAAGSMITASLLLEAQGDGLPLMWSYIQKVDDLPSSFDETMATAALVASQESIQKRKALRDIDLLALKAAPEISSCPHVDRIEAVRNVTDVLQRSRLLRDFIETFQGPRSGDWMTCALCTGGCVCYHEIMELEALAQPSRLESIQKQILIRFGGERYQGKIVCKNCGQALQDIDYDEHVEFDDNGKPVTGRSVLTEEQMADVSEGLSLATPAALTFASQSQRDISEVLQVIVDRAGIRMPEEVIRRVVRRADLYVGARAPPAAAYEAQRARAMTSATTKIRAATGTQIATVDVPTYAALLDQLRVTALTGLVALELQVADPPLEVFNPFPLCKFSRGGWPVEAADQQKESAINYISCVVASIQRDMTPWRSLSWSGLSKLESRVTAVLKASTSSLMVMVSGDPKSGPLAFTPELRDAIAIKQANKAEPIVSRGDILTHGFRPEAFPRKVARPVIEKEPLTATVEQRREVAAASLAQARAIISEMHGEAAASKKGHDDSVCCAKPIREVDDGVLLSTGSAALALASASGTVTGTRLWPSVTPTPSQELGESIVDESVYFKLFTRFCYIGPRVGYSHEFSVGDICRQCGFRLGAAEQEGPLKIEITPAAFEGLSTAVRRNMRIAPAPSAGPEENPMETIATLALSKPAFAAFGAALRDLIGAELPENKIDRAQVFGAVAALHDELKAQIVDRVGPFVPRQAGKVGEARAREATNAFRVFDTITEDPYIEGPRLIQEYWCTKTSATGRGFGITTVAGAKWFKISQEHNERINKLLGENTSWYAGAIPDAMRPVLVHVSTALAPFMKVWIAAVRPNKWSTEEMQMILQTIVLHVWRDAVSTTSWMYDGIVVAADREAIASAMANWTRALLLHVKQQALKYSKETIRQILQQRAELERTSVVKEFEEIRDDDLRAAELIKKNFRIGRWGVGKNLQKYDADLFEFESEQRVRMGIADLPVDPLLLEGAGQPAGQPAGQDYGFGAMGGPEEGYNVEQDDADNA